MVLMYMAHKLLKQCQPNLVKILQFVLWSKFWLSHMENMVGIMVETFTSADFHVDHFEIVKILFYNVSTFCYLSIRDSIFKLSNISPYLLEIIPVSANQIYLNVNISDSKQVRKDGMLPMV